MDMQVMLEMEIKQANHNQLTPWMIFYTDSISHGNQTDNYTSLTLWMGFHAGNVNNGHQADKLHTTHCLEKVSCKLC